MFADVIKFRWRHIRQEWTLWYVDKDTLTGKTSCDDGGGNWRNASTSQGTNVKDYRSEESGMEYILSWSPQDTLIFHFYTPDLWDTTFLLFQVTLFVVICCGHLGNECTMPHVCMCNFSRDQYLVFVQTKQQENLIWSVVVCKAVLWIFLSSNSKQDMYKHSLPLFNILFRLTGRCVEKDRTQNTLKCL